jgi:hypothetical protein
MQHAQVAVAGTATVVAQGGGDGEYVYIRTVGADIFLGGSTVSSSNGFKVTTTDQPVQIVLYGDDGALYAVSSGSATVHVLRTRA